MHVVVDQAVAGCLIATSMVRPSCLYGYGACMRCNDRITAISVCIELDPLEETKQVLKDRKTAPAGKGLLARCVPAAILMLHRRLSLHADYARHSQLVLII